MSSLTAGSAPAQRAQRQRLAVPHGVEEVREIRSLARSLFVEEAQQPVERGQPALRRLERAQLLDRHAGALQHGAFVVDPDAVAAADDHLHLRDAVQVRPVPTLAFRLAHAGPAFDACSTARSRPCTSARARREEDLPGARGPGEHPSAGTPHRGAL